MKNKKLFQISIWPIALFALLFLIDQTVKWYLLNYHSFLVVKNENSVLFSNLFLFITVFIILFLGLFLLEKGQKKWVLLIMLAGAAGNLFDRIFRGYIIDYFKIDTGHYIYFNFADILLILGLFIYLILVTKEIKKDEHKIFRNK